MEVDSVEDVLIEITADLVQFEKYDRFIIDLFSKPAGQWLAVKSLCRHFIEIKTHLEELEESIAGALRVTWLDFPDGQNGAGYSLIIFFCEAVHWSNLAVYNRQALLSHHLLVEQKIVA